MARKRARTSTVGDTKSDSAVASKAVEVKAGISRAISTKQEAEPATNGLGEPHSSEVVVEEVEKMNVSSNTEAEDNSDEDGDDDGSQEGEDSGDEDDDSDGDVRDFRKRVRPKRIPARANADSTDNGVSSDKEAMEFVSDGTYRNKQRVLLFSSRGITSRFRHLMADLRQLIPHHKKDVKLDVGRDESLSGAVNEIAEIKSCNSCVFLECRKKTDLYLWAGKTPNGPSAKFHVLNVHTMDELKLTGNSMLGSRPLLNFDAKFDKTPHWKVMKGILRDIFNTPRGHPKSKPFIDRIMSFFIADGKVWVRNYQIVDKGDGSNSALNRKMERTMGKNNSNSSSGDGAGGRSGDVGLDPLSLVEMGPRFVLDPIRVFAGSFGGPTLYNNGAYVSPNAVRSAKKRRAGARFEDRQEAKKVVKEKKAEPAVPRGPLDDVFSA